MKMKDWRSSTEKDGKDPNESSDVEGKEGEKNVRDISEVA